MQAQAIKINVTQFELSKAITFSKFFSKVKLKASTRLVLRCLIDHWNPDKDYCFPKQNTIAEETGCSRATVINSIEELRAKCLILTNGELGDSLKYYLTPKFFELVEIQHGCLKKTHGGCQKTRQHEQINSKQINNVSSFKKNNFRSYQNKQEGIIYKSAIPTIKQIEKDKETACTPLDFNENQALEYLNKLPDFAKNGFYAREIKKKWNI